MIVYKMPLTSTLLSNHASNFTYNRFSLPENSIKLSFNRHKEKIAKTLLKIKLN